MHLPFIFKMVYNLYQKVGSLGKECLEDCICIKEKRGGALKKREEFKFYWIVGEKESKREKLRRKREWRKEKLEEDFYLEEKKKRKERVE